MQKLIFVIGTRPQFIKHAALELIMRERFDVTTIHTGQHYDENMSDIFFEQLGIAEPTFNLKIGSGKHGVQTAEMLSALEAIFEKEKPSMVIVYGDTNSTLAGALAAVKLQIPIAHIEAGLRSYNMAMPEEVNRVITDKLSSILFCPTATAIANLKLENIVKSTYLVGDLMLDMLQLAQRKGILKKNDSFNDYYYATIHRPYNTDNEKRLIKIVTEFQKLDKKVKFSVHPRTYNKLVSIKFSIADYSNIEFLQPVSYFESLQLQYNAKAIITDSGGIQKEAYILKKQCITLRSETEWLETIEGGWNNLVFENLEQIQTLLNKQPENYIENMYGNGKCAEMITDIIKLYLN